MSYTPTEWSTGDTITAALLNKMENGIAAGGGGGGGIVTYDTSTGYIDKSYNDLLAMFQAGTLPVCLTDFEDNPDIDYFFGICTHLRYMDGTYTAFFVSFAPSGQDIFEYIASDPDEPMMYD